MHFIIAALGIAASLIFYFRVIRSGAQEIGDAAQTVANLPRKRRYQKAVRTSGYKLLESPLEAAVALMVSVANLGIPRSISEEERAAMREALTRDMEQSHHDADDVITQVEAMLYDKLHPQDAVAPCVRILFPALERTDARTLAATLDRIAAAGAPPQPDQIRMIANFRERMDLL